MYQRKLWTIPVVILMLLAPAGNVFAQTGSVPEACTGDSVTGTLTSYDEATGTAVILTETGECTVQVSSNDFTHPIVQLFDEFFGKNDNLDLAGKLTGVEGWILQDPATNTWAWVSSGTEGAVQTMVTDVKDNGDGTFTLKVKNDLGEESTVIIDDAALAAQLENGLAALEVQWNLKSDADGNSVLQSIGDEIEGYHDDGIGFGVLAKLMGITIETSENCTEASGSSTDTQCSVTLGDLVQMKQDGMGMGQIFKEYIKPAILGVGQIRQALDETTGEDAPLQEKDHGKPDKSGQDSTSSEGEETSIDENGTVNESLNQENDQPGNSDQPGNHGISDDKKNDAGSNSSKWKNQSDWFKNNLNPGKSGKKK